MIIGVSGGIGTGKSKVSRILSEYGFVIIDADQIYKDLTQANMPLVKELEKAFGEVTDNGVLNRAKLSEKALGNPLLNEITHKAISEEIDRQLKLNAGKDIVLDIPLLFESGYDKICDEIWIVVSKLEDRINRVIERDGISREEILRRINLQMSDEERIAKADLVIENFGTKEEFIEKVKGIINGRK